MQQLLKMYHNNVRIDRRVLKCIDYNAIYSLNGPTKVGYKCSSAVHHLNIVVNFRGALAAGDIIVLNIN